MTNRTGSEITHFECTTQQMTRHCDTVWYHKRRLIQLANYLIAWVRRAKARGDTKRRTVIITKLHKPCFICVEGRQVYKLESARIGRQARLDIMIGQFPKLWCKVSTHQWADRRGPARTCHTRRSAHPIRTCHTNCKKHSNLCRYNMKNLT